ncbi:MAG: hypothetical protein AAF196_19515 [Planctomycetota bacterium]
MAPMSPQRSALPSRCLLLAVATLLLTAAGCRIQANGRSGLDSDSDGFQPRAYQPLRDQPEHRLRARLEAAQQIIYTKTADVAFAKITLDAAASGCVELAQEALDEVVYSDMGDAVAYEASRHLYEAGLVEESREMADEIISTRLQDEAFQRISSGRIWSDGAAR